MKKNNLTRIILLTALTAVITLGCKKDKSTDAPLTPAYHISKSENLFIPVEVELPPNLPAGNSRIATYYAEGVQKYKAQAKAGAPGSYEWVFVAPKADLFDISNRKVGTHGAGPYWTLSAMDSIFAQPFTPAKTATPDANSIPWLQLMPKAGKTASGLFSDVAYIQRIATTGGKAPVTAPASISDTADVFYTAIYRLSKKN